MGATRVYFQHGRQWPYPHTHPLQGDLHGEAETSRCHPGDFVSVDAGGTWSHGHPRDNQQRPKAIYSPLGPAKSDADLHYKRKRAILYPRAETTLAR